MTIGQLTTEADVERFVKIVLDRMGLNASFVALARAFAGGYFLVGNGAPAGAPKAARAVYLRLDGGVGSTFYAWTGAAWSAVA